MVHSHNGVLGNCKNEWGRSLWTGKEWFPGYIVKWEKQIAKECL